MDSELLCMNCLNAWIMETLQKRIMLESPKVIIPIFESIKNPIGNALKTEIKPIVLLKNAKKVIELDIYNYYPVVETSGIPSVMKMIPNLPTNSYCKNNTVSLLNTSNIPNIMNGLIGDYFVCDEFYIQYSIRAKLYMITMYCKAIDQVSGDFNELLTEYRKSFGDSSKKEILEMIEKIGNKLKDIQGNENPFLLNSNFLKNLQKNNHACKMYKPIYGPLAQLCGGHIRFDKLISYGRGVWKDFSDDEIFTNVVTSMYKRLIDDLSGLKYDKYNEYISKYQFDRIKDKTFKDMVKNYYDKKIKKNIEILNSFYDYYGPSMPYRLGLTSINSPPLEKRRLFPPLFANNIIPRFDPIISYLLYSSYVR